MKLNREENIRIGGSFVTRYCRVTGAHGASHQEQSNKTEARRVCMREKEPETDISEAPDYSLSLSLSPSVYKTGPDRPSANCTPISRS